MERKSTRAKPQPSQDVENLFGSGKIIGMHASPAPAAVEERVQTRGSARPRPHEPAAAAIIGLHPRARTAGSVFTMPQRDSAALPRAGVPARPPFARLS